MLHMSKLQTIWPLLKVKSKTGVVDVRAGVARRNQTSHENSVAAIKGLGFYPIDMK